MSEELHDEIVQSIVANPWPWVRELWPEASSRWIEVKAVPEWPLIEKPGSYTQAIGGFADVVLDIQERGLEGTTYIHALLEVKTGPVKLGEWLRQVRRYAVLMYDMKVPASHVGLVTWYPMNALQRGSWPFQVLEI